MIAVVVDNQYTLKCYKLASAGGCRQMCFWW